MNHCIRVHFWSYFRELTGTALAEVEVPEGATVGDVVTAVHARWPALIPMRGSTLVAVGVDYADPEQRVRAGDEVSLFPPVQGG
jgi:molybdopterin converting factor small subunit